MISRTRLIRWLLASASFLVIFCWPCFWALFSLLWGYQNSAFSWSFWCVALLQRVVQGECRWLTPILSLPQNICRTWTTMIGQIEVGFWLVLYVHSLGSRSMVRSIFASSSLASCSSRLQFLFYQCCNVQSADYLMCVHFTLHLPCLFSFHVSQFSKFLQSLSWGFLPLCFLTRVRCCFLYHLRPSWRLLPFELLVRDSLPCYPLPYFCVCWGQYSVHLIFPFGFCFSAHIYVSSWQVSMCSILFLYFSKGGHTFVCSLLSVFCFATGLPYGALHFLPYNCW